MQKGIKVVFPFLLFLITFQCSFAWGFWAHQRINRLAVFTLPPEMFPLYKTHIEYLTEHAVDPDKRRYAVEWEATRHYIDVDHYGEYPFTEVPRKWYKAVEKFSEDTLNAYGIVPWHIQVEMTRLTKAFKHKELDRILKISADLGHYVADGNVPLHTTENYNGQLTNQKGIHGLWESRLPEIYGMEWDYFVGKSQYLDDPLVTAWENALTAHICLDSVLGFEENLTQTFPSDQKYSYEKRGNVSKKVYSREFCEAYHHQLNGQVERRIRRSVLMVGSFWFTAWVNAGQPDLSELTDKPIEVKEAEVKRKKKLKIIDREAGEIGAVAPPQNYHQLFDCQHHHGHEQLHEEIGRVTFRLHAKNGERQKIKSIAAIRG